MTVQTEATLAKDTFEHSNVIWAERMEQRSPDVRHHCNDDFCLCKAVLG